MLEVSGMILSSVFARVVSYDLGVANNAIAREVACHSSLKAASIVMVSAPGLVEVRHLRILAMVMCRLFEAGGTGGVHKQSPTKIGGNYLISLSRRRSFSVQDAASIIWNDDYAAGVGIDVIPRVCSGI